MLRLLYVTLYFEKLVLIRDYFSPVEQNITEVGELSG
jgi:hypothetical protein